MQARKTQPDQQAPQTDTDAGIGLTRRALFRTTLAAATSVAMGRASAGSNALTSNENKQACNLVAVSVTINEVLHRLELRSDVTLLDLLREDLQLTGTKKGCNRGECGACTVLLDGRRVNACFVLAATLDGRAVTTIEGLARKGQLHPVQQAFIECDAFQCGFCTSGQIMSALGCIREGHTKSNDEIREWMSGNLCRCSAYPQIAQAVATAAAATEGDAHGRV
ncbi:aldehyde dehydrogenase, Fe-S subunit [Burkholderia gladioli]|uniref:(2Fe-2S)-binding protein n=1 Tax=Burkholderia gladioli TaxID=28095 RepID=UPI001CB174B7|nr:(2Fe-2S)-binding protein [Burkholderia gladioli]CAG9238127.1 aldehyde dehydrogenase, Fe-S subunit [Burkholderia gladioli]